MILMRKLCVLYAVKNKIDTIINDFILQKANEIGILKENIILSGFSKGGELNHLLWNKEFDCKYD